MRKKRPGVMLYFEDFEFVRTKVSSDERLGRLLVSLVDYANNGTDPAFVDPKEMGCWYVLQRAADRDAENYARICEQNRAKRLNHRKNADLDGNESTVTADTTETTDTTVSMETNNNSNSKIQQQIQTTPNTPPNQPDDQSEADARLQGYVDSVRRSEKWIG